ncbi:MAG: hypothetical protein FJ087_02190 [Deltaproteobacteria bacterium]|nr:hypothetical protein [Deltaproteobacteria bacterium]
MAAVRHHHERFAGGGYPDGIAGDAIPRAARILAVADTCDAIASNRPYRAGAPADVACKVLREVSGKQFDPAAVDAFLAAREPGRARSPSSGVGRFRLGRLLDGGWQPAGGAHGPVPPARRWRRRRGRGIRGYRVGAPRRGGRDQGPGDRGVRDPARPRRDSERSRSRASGETSCCGSPVRSRSRAFSGCTSSAGASRGRRRPGSRASRQRSRCAGPRPPGGPGRSPGRSRRSRSMQAS